MKKHRHIALVVGLLLPLVITPFLLFMSADVCAYGPLNFITHSDSSYDGSVLDYVIIGVTSVLLLGYYFNWFLDKSAAKAMALLAGIICAEAIALFSIIFLVNTHCWVF